MSVKERVTLEIGRWAVSASQWSHDSTSEAANATGTEKSLDFGLFGPVPDEDFTETADLAKELKGNLRHQHLACTWTQMHRVHNAAETKLTFDKKAHTLCCFPTRIAVLHILVRLACAS